MPIIGNIAFEYKGIPVELRIENVNATTKDEILEAVTKIVMTIDDMQEPITGKKGKP